jgi:hypothetical protein
MKMEQQAVKLKAEVMWAQTTKINDLSGKYQLNLCQLSDAACEALQKLGIEVREKEDQGKYITCKSANPIKVFDEDNDEITEAIGNGSKAKAIITAYEWKYKNKKGVSPSLKKIVITDLVEYAKGGGGSSLKDDDEVL